MSLVNQRVHSFFKILNNKYILVIYSFSSSKIRNMGTSYRKHSNAVCSRGKNRFFFRLKMTMLLLVAYIRRHALPRQRTERIRRVIIVHMYAAPFVS